MRIENPKFNLELLKRLLHISAPMPDRIQIEITNRCNLNCAMCPKKFYNLPNENMSLDRFKKIIDKLDGVNLILPVGWGESFVHPEIDQMINYLRKKNKEVKIATNGLLLNNEKLIKTALKTDSLTFSLDQIDEKKNHGESAKIIANIKTILKRRGKKKKPYITIQPVLFKNNKDVLDVIRLASRLGVDRVNIIRPYTKFDKSIGNTWEERKEIYKEVEKLSEKLGLRVDMFEYSSFSGIKRLAWKYGKGIFRLNDWCPRLYDFAYITLDGKVTPCCALPRHIVGDLTKQTIKEIWNSKKMQAFRKNHKKICRDCEVLKIK